MPNRKTFAISSALKNIIGKELITSDFIAVFELVKNSFDAHASKVEVVFDGLGTDSPRLIIKDNGKGMDAYDLEHKWLFVAYSAKKDGSEDFRDKIQSRRIHTGSKGIGRFSCDKLGQKLTIYSRKKHNLNFTNILSVKWNDFEEDSKVEFSKIPVYYSRTKNADYHFRHGTVLEISELRENWDRATLLKLKGSLEKLINPNQPNGSENFDILLTVPSEVEADRKVPENEHWKKVNGHIKNYLFEDLGLKTTFINVKISDDGKKLHTRLEDRGVLIYEISEQNHFKYQDKLLSNIEISLFALNRSAKHYFTKHMGLRPGLFGSVLLYKNGFRIHPFGELGDDSLELDTRKTQGHSRFLGSRDLVGRIEINGDNPGFQETTSRDGGLIKNEAYRQLREMFRTFCLKRLERYAVDIVKFGNLPVNFKEKKGQGEVRSKILGLIQDLTQSENIIDIQYDPAVVDILGELSEKSLQKLLINFERIASETGNQSLVKEAKKARTRLDELNIARQEAEAEAKAEAEKARKAEKAAEKATKEVEKKTSQNLFLQSVASQDITNIVSLHHHIGIAAGTIENYIRDMTRRIMKGKPLSEEMVLEVLGKISHQAKKISATTRFATKANFSLEATSMSEDICNYISEYLLNICSGIIRTADNKSNITFTWENKSNAEFVMRFRPLEIAMVLDNLISNSRKAKSKSIKIGVSKISPDKLELLYSDDGSGISPDKANKIFGLGYTTTDGSGLGLYQVKNILDYNKASIELVKSSSKGVSFILRFNK